MERDVAYNLKTPSLHLVPNCWVTGKDESYFIPIPPLPPDEVRATVPQRYATCQEGMTAARHLSI
jgi:hypothetical protein